MRGRSAGQRSSRSQRLRMFRDACTSISGHGRLLLEREPARRSRAQSWTSTSCLRSCSTVAEPSPAAERLSLQPQLSSPLQHLGSFGPLLFCPVDCSMTSSLASTYEAAALKRRKTLEAAEADLASWREQLDKKRRQGEEQSESVSSPPTSARQLITLAGKSGGD